MIRFHSNILSLWNGKQNRWRPPFRYTLISLYKGASIASLSNWNFFCKPRGYSNFRYRTNFSTVPQSQWFISNCTWVSALINCRNVLDVLQSIHRLYIYLQHRVTHSSSKTSMRLWQTWMTALLYDLSTWGLSPLLQKDWIAISLRT